MDRFRIVTFLAIFHAALVAGCNWQEREQQEVRKSPSIESVQKMKLTSSGFESGQTMDAKYTVEGDDISPPLSWSDVPERTDSFAVICEDPDAPSPDNPAPDPWVHWVLFNIPADTTELPAAISRESQPDEVPGALQGQNSFPKENIGYRGPAPPPGSGIHRYFFRVYALDTQLNLKAGVTKQDLLDAMSGHLLGEAEIYGTYQR